MEIWKEIKGFERYEVSNTGKVRSKAFTRINERIRNGKKAVFSCFYPAKELKPDIIKCNNTSYARVTLSKDNKQTRVFVHRLVALAFLENKENKPCVNHIDNNGLNDNVENLEWCTHSENMIHAQNQGRLFQSQSKGGKAGSVFHTKEREKRVERLKNTYINDWHILNEAKKVGRHWKMLCQCKCGRYAWHCLDRLSLTNKNPITQCNSCSKKKEVDKDIV